MGPSGELVHSDAFPPETLVDTLGAGDTFNAAVIFALSAGGHSPAWARHGHGTAWHSPARLTGAHSPGRSLQDALTFGCQVAGKKCGIQGYDGIV